MHVNSEPPLPATDLGPGIPRVTTECTYHLYALTVSKSRSSTIATKPRESRIVRALASAFGAPGFDPTGHERGLS
jgi:hypothetical protein